MQRTMLRASVTHEHRDGGDHLVTLGAFANSATLLTNREQCLDKAEPLYVRRFRRSTTSTETGASARAGHH